MPYHEKAEPPTPTVDYTYPPSPAEACTTCGQVDEVLSPSPSPSPTPAPQIAPAPPVQQVPQFYVTGDLELSIDFLGSYIEYPEERVSRDPARALILSSCRFLLGGGFARFSGSL